MPQTTEADSDVRFTRTLMDAFVLQVNDNLCLKPCTAGLFSVQFYTKSALIYKQSSANLNANLYSNINEISIRFMHFRTCFPHPKAGTYSAPNRGD